MANILKYNGYHGTIEFSAEDNMLIGSVIGIQDSLNFHGHSIEEITQSFHDCIDGYLEMCAAFGRSPDKVYKGSFNIRIPQDLHRQAAIMAENDLEKLRKVCINNGMVTLWSSCRNLVLNGSTSIEELMSLNLE
jgi:predicted HicB family RNase H-like nuclease